jgi:hypothetical protein
MCCGHKREWNVYLVGKFLNKVQTRWLKWVMWPMGLLFSSSYGGPKKDGVCEIACAHF